DPVVEALDHERDQTDHDDNAGDDEPQLLAPDEVEGRLAVVEAVAEAALGCAGVSHRYTPAFTSVSSDAGAARPPATPSHLASVNRRLRRSSTTMGRVNRYAVITSSTVDRPRKKANPRTEPTLSR